MDAVIEALPETVAVRIVGDPAEAVFDALESDESRLWLAWMKGRTRLVVDIAENHSVGGDVAWFYVWVAYVAHMVGGAPVTEKDVASIAGDALTRTHPTPAPKPEAEVETRRRWRVGDPVFLPKSIVKPGLWRDHLVAPAGARGVVTRAPRLGRMYDVTLEDGQTVLVWADELEPAPVVVPT